MSGNLEVDIPGPQVALEDEVPVSPDLQKVLDGIPKNVPEVFHHQAARVAQFITQLDNNPEFNDPEVQTFVKEVRDSGYISLVYIFHHSKLGRGLDPAEALPGWLQTRKNIPENIEEEIEELFGSWVGAKGLSYQDFPDGRYYRLKPRSQLVPLAQHYKCYLENENLLAALKEGRLQTVLENLEEKGISPYDMKLFDNSRLVLYFDQKVESYGEADKICKTYGILVRGPAQDVFEIDVQDDGSLKERVFTSNDGALGEGGHNPRLYNVEHYAPAAFLENYLNLCLYAGKEPDEPYKTSFVYLIDKEDLAQGFIPEVVNQAQEMTGYPVCYAKTRYEVVINAVLPSTQEETPEKGKNNHPFWQRIFRRRMDKGYPERRVKELGFNFRPGDSR
jgi:hypothetical protein